MSRLSRFLAASLTAAIALCVPATADASRSAVPLNSSTLTPLKTSPLGRAAAHGALLDPNVPIIVLGARLNAGSCSMPAVLVGRVDEAAKLALAHPLNPVIVSGGVTQPGCPSEAAAMKQALVRSGVSAHRITTESTSQSTVGNAAGTSHFAKKLIGIGPRTGVLVTSDAHMPRALDTFAARDNQALWLATTSQVN